VNSQVHRVAVTGASGYVGARLVERLEREPGIDRVLALDIRPPPRPFGPETTFLRHDVSTPRGRESLDGGIDARVHLAYVLNPGHDREQAHRVNVDGTEHVLQAVADAGVGKVIYFSSTSVYGAHPDNPPLLTEDLPPRPLRGFQYSEDKVLAEALVQDFAARTPGVEATILRGCPVMGPNADNFISRAFLKPLLVAVSGYDPPMQFVHEDDVVDVLARCVLGRATGLYNVGGDDAIRWSEMARMIGRRLVSLPAPVLYGATAAAWALRLQSDAPSCGINFIRYRWTASTEKIRRELGVVFRYTSRESWQAFADRVRGKLPSPESRD